MRLGVTRLALAALAAGYAAAAAGQVPDRDEYAWHFPLDIVAPGEFQALDVPFEVYRSVTDPELRDLGVYNAAGRAVPRTFERPEEQVEMLETRAPLGVLPLYGEISEAALRLQLLMQIDEPGTSLKFQSELPEPADPQLQLRALIVDLREHDDRISALEFSGSGAPGGFIGTVIIEDGYDLASWAPLAQGMLADLAYEEARIEQKRIDVDRQPGDYLRVTWRGMPSGWRPESMTAIRRELGPAAEREWLEIPPVERSEDGRSFIYALDGYPPVDRVDLAFPGGRGVVRASVEVRDGPEDEWRQRHDDMFYRIAPSGNELVSSPAVLKPTRSTQWRVQLRSGQVDGDLRLRLGWRPDRLLFLAQGEAPFSLASGRARDQLEQFPQDRQMGDGALFSMLEQAGEPGLATIGARRIGAGEQALTEVRRWGWRTVLVWTGLLAAVGLVGFLVWALLREERARQTTPTIDP